MGDIAFAQSFTLRVEQIPNVIVHSEVEHLPPCFDQSNGLLDQLLPAVPVGMLERIVEDKEGGFVVECDAGEAEPGAQEDLLEAVVAAQPKTVLVMINGGMLSISWAKDHVPAILEAYCERKDITESRI